MTLSTPTPFTSTPLPQHQAPLTPHHSLLCSASQWQHLASSNSLYFLAVLWFTPFPFIFMFNENIR